ncbi:Methyltransferase small domain-containing protein [Sanguibacter gelidistatuariae]|uniref:Methyltransferase small domain-containing protein n=1 Tax=Sanguibacter gelidistatuariae TaxID=1814289 RepID=A0A1G6HQ76_9MICO|nr:methyltransferase [Sanguibacter gelidistatuariae]SDB95646.1 Methyltransferase small domain-containing protein [Sanguibacter gelidistatuariae]
MPLGDPTIDPRLLPLLRDDLAAASYTVDGVEDFLGPLAAAALHREQAVPALRVARAALGGATETASGQTEASREPRAVLTALFLLGLEVTRADVDAALPTVGTDGATRLGLVVAAGTGPGDGVRALLDLRPYDAADATGPVSWWLASDLGELATGRRLAGDHVLGAGGASITLAQVTMRTPVGRVLDLGTGCGIQALHASRHAGAVVATDISRRALRFAEFNAALDQVHLDLREGSMLEPVAGELFDLVVSNPPFVITPRAAGTGTIPDYEYRDGGRAGDDLVRDLIQGVGDVLAPGGVAQLLGNWEHRRGEGWTERVGGWLDEAGLDGWVIQREVLDPAEYAETWIRDGGTTPEREPAEWAASYEAWLDDFATRDVEAVGFGIVTLRKPVAPSGTSLRRLEEHTGSVRQPLGGHLAASLAAHDWLEATDDAALAAARLTVAPDVSEERYLTPGAGDPNVVIIRQGDGLGRGIQASAGLAALVGASDGELSVGQLTAAIASLFEVPAGELAGELLPAVRGLVRDGFLTPAP